MRTALFAGLVAGTAVLHALPGHTAEGPSLRGLKLPQSTLEAYSLASAFPKSAPATQAGSRIGFDMAPRASYYTGAADTRRITLGGAEYRVGLYRPSGPLPPLHGGLGAAHEPFPRHTLHTQAAQRLPAGWGIALGVRQSEYSFSNASLLALSAERHWGSLRGAYTLYSHRLDGASGGLAHRFQVSYAYGERNTIGLAYTTGRDVESLALPAGAAVADVRDLSLSGRHWLSTNWALTYDVQQEQNVLYRRQGLRLGVSRSF
jgi:YaiO family outer membrane protein